MKIHLDKSIQFLSLLAMASRRSKPTWQDTWLWKLLEKRARQPDNEAARQFIGLVENWMKILDAVLSSGGTSPAAFTLHDSEHAVRVAHRIDALLTPVTRKNLSDYEAAFLLLAAYGHDIGMSPARKKVQAHYQHLLAPLHSELTKAEKLEFQRFLDNYRDSTITLPLTASIDDLNLADELTAFYVRDKHNEWSAQWIRENLNGEFPDFADWKETLIELCQSHHFGFEQLKHPQFDPRLVGGGKPQILHLRFLACLLRLADILENDPERTPMVIFRHRNVKERSISVVHWEKDHDLTIDIREASIRFQARPRNARVHKALLQLADWIDHELHGIAAFDEQLPSAFKIGNVKVKRDWHLAPALSRDIQPRPGTYEYIDGAFRPNTQRLLQLLSGEQLYSEPLAAVRELLQNAFDAVREKIARRRLQLDVAQRADPIYEKRFGDEELVTLTLQQRTVASDGKQESQLWLVCEDTGVGLTKEIITGHLLVSGNSRRHDILALERECALAGFRLGRTGQFGIGVLSYFMMAREVHITTTRFQACNDLDAPGWSFVTHGIGDFGELRQMSRSPFPHGGSQVEWRLREVLFADSIENFGERLFQYIYSHVINTPCRFICKIDGTTVAKTMVFDTGWTHSISNLIFESIQRWTEPQELKFELPHFISDEKAEEQESIRSLYAQWLNEAREFARYETRDIPLPDSLGHLRVAVPYFDLAEGRSLIFLFRGEANEILPVFKQTNNLEQRGLTLCAGNVSSWRGMRCELGYQERRHFPFDTPLTFPNKNRCFFWIDFTESEAGVLEVSRGTLKLSEKVAHKLEEFIAKQIRSVSDQVLESGRGCLFRNINQWLQNQHTTFSNGVGIFTLKNQKLTFSAISFPLVTLQHTSLPQTRLPRGRIVDYQAREYSILESLNTGSMWPTPDSIKVIASRVSPMPRGQYTNGDLQSPVAVWEGATSQTTPKFESPFPPEWSHLFALRIESIGFVMNPANLWTSLLDDEQKEVIGRGGAGASRLALDDIAGITSGRSAIGLITRLGTTASGNRSQWITYAQKNPTVVQNIWRLAAEDVGCSISDLHLHVFHHGAIHKLSREDWAIVSAYSPSHANERIVTDETWILREVDRPSQKTQ